MSSIQCSEHVRTVADDNGAVLMDIHNDTYYSLNPMASRIWDLVKSGSSEGDIVETLLLAFDVPAEDLRLDIKRLVEDLSKKGLVCDQH